MDDWKNKIAERLAEVFQGETQYVTAKKLHTTQGNISKWLSGQQTPTVDTCRDIARVYDVSVDWLLGLSDKKHSDDISVEKLTYEQVARIIDRLLDNGTISIPDLNEIRGEAQPLEDTEEPLEDEDSETHEDGEIVPFPITSPDYDSDYLKVNDRVLSYMLRRRQKIYDIGVDLRNMWQDNSLPHYRGIALLKYVGNMEAAIDTNSWSAFNSDADWVALIQKLSNMTEEERAALIENAERAKAKRKA